MEDSLPPTAAPPNPSRGSRLAIVVALVFAVAGIAIQAFAVKMAHDIDLKPDEQISGRELADIGTVMVIFIMACGFPFTTIAGIMAIVGTCRRTDLRRAHGGVLGMIIAVEIALIAMMAISLSDVHAQATELDGRKAPSSEPVESPS